MNLSYASKVFSLTYDDGTRVDVPFIFSDKNNKGILFPFVTDPDFTLQEWHRSSAEDESTMLITHCLKGKKKNFRIGWMTPASALVSDAHRYAANCHYAYYAFYAYIMLLSREEVHQKIHEGNTFEDVIDELYGANDVCFMIVENANIQDNLYLKEIEISLYQYGYYRNKPFVNSLTAKLPAGKDPKIFLRRTAKLLKKGRRQYIDGYIEEYLYNNIYHDNPFIHFILLFQIVEVMFDDSLVDKLKNLLGRIDKGTASIRQIDSALKNNTESDRFKQIVKNSGVDLTQYKVLKDKCKDFLPKFEESAMYELPECIYQTRNRIVHRFRLVTGDEVKVKVINEHLQMFLFDLMINYKRI